MSQFSTPKALLPIVRPIRALFPNQKISLMVVGSFISVRVEDPDETLAYRTAHQIFDAARAALTHGGLIDPKSGHDSPLMDGAVCTWERK